MPLPPDERDARREAVRALLAARVVRSQEELAERLAKQGYSTTQSSLSRDLRELRAAKLDGRYVLPDAVMRMNGNAAAVASADSTLAAAAGFVVQVRSAGPNLVVVRTTPGAASAVALAIDAVKHVDVVGTVAGDDTLFVAVPGRAAGIRFETRLRAALTSTRTENAGD